MNQKSILAAELFIDDVQANAKLEAFPAKLKAADDAIDRVGKNTQFGRSVSKQFDEIERSASKTSSLVSGAFSPENLISGVAIGAVVGFGNKALEAAKNADNGQRLLQATSKETGLAFADLTNQAKAFGEATLQSSAQANAGFAQITNFANAAGRADKLEQFSKAFADLAAAKGIDPSQIGDIARQLNALTDEATDKLLNANPSAFYDKFAKSIGKTADSLTDAEKRAAVFDETLKKGAIFTGEAEKRVNASASAVDRLSIKWDRVKESIGGAIIPLTEFLEKSVQLATADPKLYQRKDNSGNEAIFADKRAREFAENLRASDARIREAQTNPLGNLQNFALSKVNLATGFFDLKERNKAIEAATKEATDFADNLRKRVEAALASKNQNLIGLAQKELRPYLNLFDNETRGKLTDDFSANDAAQLEKRVAKAKEETDKFTRSVDQGKSKVAELEKAYISFVDNAFAKSGSNNPFVSVFSEAEKAINSTRETLKGLSSDVRSTFEQLIQKQNDLALFSARLDNNLNVFDLREDASRFRGRGGGLEPNVDRAIKNYLAADPTNRGNQILAGDPNAQNDPTKKRELFELATFFAGSENGTNLDFLTTYLGRLRLEATEGSSGDISSRLQKQLAIVAGSNPKNQAEIDLANRKIIALTGSIDPGKLTDSQREAAASARIREAERLERAESEAKAQRAELIKVQKQVLAETAALRSVAEKEGLSGIVRIIDETKGAASVEQKAPTPADTAKKYNSQSYGQSTAGNRLSSF